MTFIPLTHKNFVKNKVESLLKVEYKNSDPTTYIYDQNIDSKSLININSYRNFSTSELNLNGNESDLSIALKRVDLKNLYTYISENDHFYESYSIITPDDPIPSNVNTQNYFTKRKEYQDKIENYRSFNGNQYQDIVNYTVNNSDIKSFLFRNSYKIDRIEQHFLPDSFSLQKKNYVKNRLYGDYKKDYSLDFYNDLNYGYCNWNSINFFSQRFDNNLNHSNCIIWPNTIKSNGENQYNFINRNSFNLSLYFNLRKNYSSESNPECIFHVPNVISIYIIRNTSSLKHRIGITLGEKTKNNLKSYLTLNDLVTDVVKDDIEGLYLSSVLNILNNRWYNLSLNYFKNQNNQVNLGFFIDGVKLFETEIVENRENYTGNSFICLGNRPIYGNNVNYSHVFYQIFAREFDKDISLGKENEWQDDGQILTSDPNYTGNITFENRVNSNSESFHGEIHDIRIYSDVLNVDFINNNICNKTIEDIELEENIEFYVPVFYVPYFIKKRGSFNANATKINLRYSCIFNPFLANTCGGLEVSSENYLTDFIKHTKPNIVIGGKEEDYIYRDFFSISNSSLLSYTDDHNDIKTGILQKSIYNKNLKDSSHSNRLININSNISYRNLLILPNDNGIQDVYFEPINSIINEYSNNSIKLDDSLFNETLNFNITVENIHKNKNYNYSWNLDNSRSNNITPERLLDIDDNINVLVKNPNFLNYNEQDIDTIQSFFEDFFNVDDNGEVSDLATIFDVGLENINVTPNISKDKLFNYSNFIFHDNIITNVSEIDLDRQDINLNNYTSDEKLRVLNLEQECKEIYQISFSNPILRHYKESISDLVNRSSTDNSHTESLEYKNTQIQFLRLPVPYSVINKDYDSIFTTIFDIPSKFYNKNIKKDTFEILDDNVSTSNGNINLKFSDNKNGGLYRDNCKTKVASWNYVGHIFYKDGIASLNRPELVYFGEDDFSCNFFSNSYLYVNEINIPARKGLFDKSSNKSYNEDLRHDESAFNSEESFVYITDINLHDENLNIVAKAKLARPAPKKLSDSILFRLKMDY